MKITMAMMCHISQFDNVSEVLYVMLQYHRISRGLTYDTIHTLAGIPPNKMHQYETCKSVPSTEEMGLLVDLFENYPIHKQHFSYF